ncbi:class I SAM-dependent DNA methyltransferase [Enterococcus sp. LJL51]|uniref:class I SAM-dependent DNA methyltransferase n=1 Tax=Enterococcus sp. LJL51 TaxID=3416656 RepID=UPI003CE91AC7
MNKFEQIANHYDSPERLQIAEQIADKIRQTVKTGEYDTALDFGSGTGLVGLQLIDLFSQMIFVDTSGNMLEIARKKIDQQKIDSITLLHQDLFLDSKGISADFVYLSQVLLHIPDTAAVFSLLKSLINPGGKLVIVDFDKEESIQHPDVHNGFSHRELIHIAEQAGFKNIQMETFYHGKNMFMNKDASLFILQAEN